jgi:predicted signal transduction protein with EAL and GGDEF domain
MARAMQIRSVADGVDDPATLEMLTALGCDEIQGLHVGPPMKPRDFEDWFDRGGARHLRHRHGIDPRDLPGGTDLPVNDVMQWANG